MTDGATQKEDELRKRADAALGKVLRDKWKLEKLLGIGGMAAVFAATHRNGKRAAVKVLHPEAALAPTVKDRFLREGYLANKVEHPGAVSILDDDVDVDGTVFLVMELLVGETLEARLGRSGGRIPFGEILQVIDPVLDCLVAAHDKGIVHRDLKPGNLFVTETGAVKVLDFGIARLEEVGTTRPGGTGSQTLGTPGFMPPEQARGRWEEVDAKSDLWAVGAVMFAALAGKHVHEAPTVNEQLLAAMTVPAEPLEKAVPGAPPELAALVDRALAFDKANRFANAREMRDAVRATYLALEGKPLVSAPRLSVRPPSVNPISANMATLDGSAEALAQVTTARPVIQGRPAQAPGSSRKLALGAALAVAALVGAWLLVRAPADAAHAESSAAGSAHVAAPSAAVPAGMHAELPAPAPEDRPSPSATVPSAVASAPPTSPKPAPVKRVAAPRSGSAPAADVDIFSKRR